MNISLQANVYRKRKEKAEVGRDLTAKPHRTLEHCFDLVNKSSILMKKQN